MGKTKNWKSCGTDVSVTFLKKKSLRVRSAKIRCIPQRRETVESFVDVLPEEMWLKTTEKSYWCKVEAVVTNPLDLLFTCKRVFKKLLQTTQREHESSKIKMCASWPPVSGQGANRSICYFAAGAFCSPTNVMNWSRKFGNIGQNSKNIQHEREKRKLQNLPYCRSFPF